MDALVSFYFPLILALWTERRLVLSFGFHPIKRDHAATAAHASVLRL